jgi:hypothetical protein
MRCRTKRLPKQAPTCTSNADAVLSRDQGYNLEEDRGGRVKIELVTMTSPDLVLTRDAGAATVVLIFFRSLSSPGVYDSLNTMVLSARHLVLPSLAATLCAAFVPVPPMPTTTQRAFAAR